MEGPIKTDDLEVSIQPQKEDEKIIEAREHIRGLLRLMIDKMGVDIPESEWPQVGPVPEKLKNSLKTSAYHGANNAIYIYSGHVGSGLVYAEEVGHFIRAYICRTNKLEALENPAAREAVGEFFGRLGENIAREAAQGTELEPLFEEKERDHLQNEEILEVIRNQVDIFRPHVEDLSLNLEQKMALKLEGHEKLKDFYKKIEEVEEAVLVAQAQGIPPEQVAKDIKLSLVEDSKGIKELIAFALSTRNGGSRPKWVDAIMAVVEETASNLNTIDRVIENFTRRSVSELYTEILEELSDLKGSCDFQFSQMAWPDWELISMLNAQNSQLYHVLGYASAEYFMAHNPDWSTRLRDIFSDSDEVALDKYFEDEGFTDWTEQNKEIAELLELINKLQNLESDMSIPVEEEETGLDD
jgi:hypothetical protein